MKKEFNLEEALKGAKLVTRDGREVSEWKYFETKKGTNSIVAIVNGDIYFFSKEGNSFDNNVESDLDLFILTEPKKCYVNVYVDMEGMHIGIPCDTLKEAELSIMKHKTYIKTIEITDEP